MYLYYSLLNLGSLFGGIRGEFIDLGNAIRTVWLIGQYLSTPFFYVAGFFGSLQNGATDAAGDWLGFYNWIIDNLGIDERITDLLRYADDLLNFIRYPFEFISDALRDAFPELFKIAKDPIDWLLESITRYTGIDWDFLDNPLRWVQDKIRDLAGDVIDIARDPRGWFLDWLDNIIPDFMTFAFNTRAWLQDKINDAFPFLMDFFRDPDNFLEDKFMIFLDRLATKYRPRVIKLTEKILDTIF